MNKAYVIDTETTGREPPEVIELAYLEVDELLLHNGGHPTNKRFKPTLGSCYGALSTHHILDEELEDLTPSSEAAIPSDAAYIIGHNIDYDWGALGKPTVKRICTLAIARKLYPEIDSHKLGAMVYKFFVPTTARKMLLNAHMAAADVELCLDVLLCMLHDKDIKWTTFEDLWKFSEQCRIPSVFGFGKYKGKLISETPRDYRAWCLRQPDFDPYYLQAIKETM